MPAWSKKISVDASQQKRTLQKVRAYLQNQQIAEQNYSQSMEDYFRLNNLNVCFQDLQKHINMKMIVEIPKFTKLHEGIYILLQGSVIYTWTRYRHDRAKRDHLFALAKSGNYSNIYENSAERINLLKNGYSLLINTPLAVLESQGNNILANDDCVLIRLTERAVECTKFTELKEERANIFSKIKLPGIHNYSIQNLVAFNSNLHHTIKLRQMSFRNKFQVLQLGVVINGSASLKINCQQKVQFSKFCIILPNFQYDVSTSEIEILEIEQNPTILFKNQQKISRFVEDLKVSQQEPTIPKKQMRKYRQQSTMGASLRKQKQDLCLTSKQRKEKKKELSIFSKQYEQFCLVPIEMNKQNLTQLKLKRAKDQPNQNALKPRILFNFQQKLSQRLFKSGSFSNRTNFKHNNSSLAGQKIKLMERYEVYAKEIFDQFAKQYKSPPKQ